MPFDPLGFEDIQVPTVKPFDFDTATGDERLLELARWLDDEQSWRDSKMEWKFSTTRACSNVCGTAGCAIGLALLLWGGPFDGGDFWEGTTAFGITDAQWWGLFGRGLAKNLGFCEADEFDGEGHDDAYDSVTPGMVATAIKEFVAARSAS